MIQYILNFVTHATYHPKIENRVEKSPCEIVQSDNLWNSCYEAQVYQYP